MTKTANLKLTWEKHPIGTNVTLNGPDFFISFLSKDAKRLTPLFENEEVRDETALWIEEKFYILNGDWRKEYEQAFLGGKVACKKLYDEKKKEHRSFWSEDENE